MTFEAVRQAILTTVLVSLIVILPARADRSAFIDRIPVGSSWVDVTPHEGNHLRIDYRAQAYSGGGTSNGRTVVFGGGHNDGMSDAVAYLDWRKFETVGWVEEFPSTADHIGVADQDWAAIGKYANAKYNRKTPGGLLDARGPVALSRHTYDQLVVLEDRFYLFGGVLPFENRGQPKPRWRTPDEGDIWRYDFGVGWTYISKAIGGGWPSHSAAALDTLTGDIWVHDDKGLRRFDVRKERLGPAGDALNSQAIESTLNFNPDKGARGTLFGAGTYKGLNWHEYDIATGRQRNMGRVPGNVAHTYIIYIAAAIGTNYGTYFAFVPADGTLRRWSGKGWDTVAAGAPKGEYVYGRVGFEPIHQVFYWITNDWSGNDAWRTYVARPYSYP